MDLVHYSKASLYGFRRRTSGADSLSTKDLRARLLSMRQSWRRLLQLTRTSVWIERSCAEARGVVKAATVWTCTGCSIDTGYVGLILEWLVTGSSPKNPTAGYAVRAFFFVVILRAAFPARATPPTPPAQLEIANEAELSRLLVREGAFEVPVRIARSSEVSRLTLRVHVLTSDPVNPTRVRDETVKVPTDASSGCWSAYPCKSAMELTALRSS